VTTSNRIGQIAIPAAIVGIVVMMVVPLPTALLDLLLVANIAFATLALLASMSTRRVLDFSIFPAFLLIATLFRLALNVSVTRLVLLDGYAGKVIKAFGEFVIGGSVIVGLVIFLILIVIQFIVITNGAGRVAEVAARFTLDAMPGKQMAIDADLNAGIIDEEEAKRRRREIADEADFYGAMDGASKFVKGDAIAAIVIVMINLIGGFAVGMMQKGMSFGEAVETYSLLTVGDGLVAQIPALLISLSSGLIVTRAATESDLGTDLLAQFTRHKRTLQLAGGTICLTAVVPGLPKPPFLLVGGVLLILASRLPSDEELAERRAAKRGLTAPEAAVLLACSKIWLYDELLASDVPEEPTIATAIERYFPQPLREPYRKYIAAHPLAREIIATHVTNSMINRVGSTFVHRMREETGAASADVVRAYIVAREAFGMVELWRAVEALDTRVPDRVQTELLLAAGRLMVRATLWLLRNRAHLADVAAAIARFEPGVRALARLLPEALPDAERGACRQLQARFVSTGVPEALAARVAVTEELFAALDIVEVAAALRCEPELVARLYFALGGKLEFPWLRARIDQVAASTHWQALAKAALRDDLASMQRQLTAVALRAAPAERDPVRLAALWETAHKVLLERFGQLLADLKSAEAPDLAMLSVAMRELRNLSARS